MNPSLSAHQNQYSLRGVAADTLRPLSAIAATRHGSVPQARICRVFLELAGPLVALHQKHGAHGAISCETIALDATGYADLISANPHNLRTADATALLHGRAFGFNAFEQYTNDPQWPVGPWTDVYALSAVACCLVSGHAPPPAIDRCVEDGYRPLADQQLKGYSHTFLSAIDSGLALRPSDRPQDVAALLHAMGIDNVAVVEACAAGVLPNGAYATMPETPSPEVARRTAESDTPAIIAAATPLTPCMAERLNAIGLPRWLYIPAGLALAGIGVFAWLSVTNPAFPLSRPKAMPLAELSNATHRTGHLLASDATDRTQQPLHNQAASRWSEVGGEATASRDALAIASSSQSGDVPTAPPASIHSGSRAATEARVNNAGEGGHGVAALPAAVQAPVLAVQSVSVNVEPWGEIFVNGIRQGVSPPLKRISLRPGTYRVSVRNPSAEPHIIKLVVESGKKANISHRFATP